MTRRLPLRSFLVIQFRWLGWRVGKTSCPLAHYILLGKMLFYRFANLLFVSFVDLLESRFKHVLHLLHLNCQHVFDLRSEIFLRLGDNFFWSLRFCSFWVFLGFLFLCWLDKAARVWQRKRSLAGLCRTNPTLDRSLLLVLIKRSLGRLSLNRGLRLRRH